VGRFRIDTLAELARQMAFTPLDTRAAQVDAAENLLQDIDPGKAYPLAFIVFRITGYHPKAIAADLLTGLALQHDLGLLIEQVSETLNLHSERQQQPVLSIDSVGERFNVTSKTIQRWRRKGLPARRFIFPDGKLRVGFLLSSVERFFNAHQEQAPSGANFSAIGPTERDEILRRARRLAITGRCCVDEITRRVGRRMRRSTSAVFHVVTKHDEQSPADAILPAALPALNPVQQAKIVRGHRRGLSLRTLARRIKRPRSAVYRALLDERLARLARRKAKFIDDPLYHQPDAAAAIEAIAAPSDDLMARPRPQENRVPRDLPPYLAELYRTPLLSPSRERALFLKFNFHKFQFALARRRIDPQRARARDLSELERYLSAATETKNDIVRANLRLVVSVARQHHRSGISLMELISEGNLTLLRAVESFDPHRGNRFSTYATLALMKGFARTVPQLLASRSTGEEGGDLAAIPDPQFHVAGQRLADREQVSHLLGCLSDRERRVLLAHYGLGSARIPATYDEVGQSLGISRQRVRQIERAALAKLRLAATGAKSGGNLE
jgi:RNA polymerase sigma factor (sigma-70 family)